MRRLYLVRHAKAGDREKFADEDWKRPLTAKGREQALRLAQLLASERPAATRVYSSPAVRCVDTVSPFAELAGVGVEEVGFLAEGESPAAALEALTAEGEEAAVACSHGDVIWGVLELLAARKVDLGDRPDAPKAGTWAVSFHDDGEPAAATFLPPPALR